MNLNDGCTIGILEKGKSAAERQLLNYHFDREEKKHERAVPLRYPRYFAAKNAFSAKNPERSQMVSRLLARAGSEEDAVDLLDQPGEVLERERQAHRGCHGAGFADRGRWWWAL